MTDMTSDLDGATRSELNDYLRPYVVRHFDQKQIREARDRIAQVERTGGPVEIPFTSRLSAFVTYDREAGSWSARMAGEQTS